MRTELTTVAYVFLSLGAIGFAALLMLAAIELHQDRVLGEIAAREMETHPQRRNPR